MHPTTARWFAEYAADHRHPTNRLTHKVAIPAILFHIFAMLAYVPVAEVGGFPLTLGLLAWLGASIFWVRFLPKSGLILALVSLPAAIWGALVPFPALVVLAVVAWVIQLAGHSVWEKNRPSFLRNLVQSLIGPLFFSAVLTGEFGGKKPVSEGAEAS